MVNAKKNPYLYLVYFVTRAFFISILCLLCILLLFVFIYFGDLLIHTNSDHKVPLFSTYVIASPSMDPTIQVDDAIIVKRVDNDNYGVGDIITFASADTRSEGLTITHRIVDKRSVAYDSSLYTTKGDNNVVADPTSVNTDSIYGKVVFKIPKVGCIQKFFSNPMNYFLCLIVPAIIFIGYDVIRILYMMYRKRAI